VRPLSVLGVRFPVQYVLRPDANFRGFAGQVAGGVIRPGDAVMAVPSGQKSRVDSIITYDGLLGEASSSMSVTLTLEDEIDLSRGDMLVSPADPPHVLPTVFLRRSSGCMRSTRNRALLCDQALRATDAW